MQKFKLRGGWTRNYGVSCIKFDESNQVYSVVRSDGTGEVWWFDSAGAEIYCGGTATTDIPQQVRGLTSTPLPISDWPDVTRKIIQSALDDGAQVYHFQSHEPYGWYSFLALDDGVIHVTMQSANIPAEEIPSLAWKLLP